ncbi:MAG: hypothetical protein WAW00_00010 [Candidatus Moraniibacteriota bacterium]
MRLSEARGAEALQEIPTVQPRLLAVPAKEERRQGAVAESHGTYDEAMEKTARAYIREFEASEDALESWGEHIGAEYGSSLPDDTEAMEQKSDGQETAAYHALSGKIGEIGNEWNMLDDRIVENGRRRVGLLAELRALESQMPEHVLALKKEALERFDAAHAAMDGETRAKKHTASDHTPRNSRVTHQLASKESGNKRPEKKKGQPRDMTLFAETSKRLKTDQVFRKDGQPLLIIRAIAPEGIRIEHRTTVSETEWSPDVIKPQNIRGFLGYLQREFGWVSRERKRSPKRHERTKTIPGKAPADSAAEKQAVPEERAYEALEADLPAVKKKQCASVVSEGLSPFVQHAETNMEITLQQLVEQAGIENVVRNIVPSITRTLSTESRLSEEEKILFASEFAKREIIESLR